MIFEKTLEVIIKKNEKKDTTSHRNKKDIKKEYTRKSRIRISEETINILKH